MSITVNLTAEEIAVACVLMQLGVKSLAGEPFDQATSSYMHLRGKFVAAQKSTADAANDAGEPAVPAVAAAE